MIRSMTAFARGEYSAEWGDLTLELRSVNHRYLDVAVRAPEELRALEMEIRERIGRRLSRGKIDCNIRYQQATVTSDALHVDTGLVEQISKISREIDTKLYNPAPINSLDVMRWPGVMKTPDIETETIHNSFLQLLDETLNELISVRESEGSKLKELIQQRCVSINGIVSDVLQAIPEIKQAYREKLTSRLDELKVDLDETRLEQELVFLAQKMDVEEELDRLAAHVKETTSVLKRDEPVGRRLDFLMQELNREANTLGSKSIDARTTNAAVELKVLIEQMREQVQNIE